MNPASKIVEPKTRPGPDPAVPCFAKPGFLYDAIQVVFSRAYALVTGDDPYPLKTLLLDEFHRVPPGKILDAGCGSGRFAVTEYDYTGVDPNPHYIAYCKKKRTGTFLQMNAESLQFEDKTFDTVICFSVGHHLADESLAAVLREITRVLADDGRLIFADPVRPIVSSRIMARVLEGLDEGNDFRTEDEYLYLFEKFFKIERKQKLTDQFYQTLCLFCRKQ